MCGIYSFEFVAVLFSLMQKFARFSCVFPISIRHFFSCVCFFFKRTRIVRLKVKWHTHIDMEIWSHFIDIDVVVVVVNCQMESISDLHVVFFIMAIKVYFSQFQFRDMDEVFYFHGNWIFCSLFIYSIHFRMHAITFADSILTISLFANFQYILFVLLCNIRSLTWLSLLQSLSDAYHFYHHFAKRFFYKQDALLSFAHRHRHHHHTCK